MGQVEAGGSRRFAAGVGVACALVAAAALAVAEPWHGPIVVSLSSGHGISSGDLLPVALVAFAAWLARSRSRSLLPRRRPLDRAPTAAGPTGSRRGPAAAVVLGVLLLVVSVVDLTDRGPLVPAGGGTFDGTVQLVTGRTASPVGEWTFVAVTGDGTTLRLYVDGTEVASRPTSGALATSGRPLWIGGNEPYDECFEGVIDDVRVYARALGRDEIRADMATAVTAPRSTLSGSPGASAPRRGGAPDADLVGSYAFDEGAGTAVADDSGNGNGGTVVGAAWTPGGRHRGALRFDGAGDRCPGRSVPVAGPHGAAHAVGLGPAHRRERGWRTIVHRERDTWFLAAGSSRTGVSGWADDALAGIVVAAGLWLIVVTAGRRDRWLGERRRTARGAVVVVLGGVVLDLAVGAVRDRVRARAAGGLVRGHRDASAGGGGRLAGRRCGPRDLRRLSRRALGDRGVGATRRRGRRPHRRRRRGAGRRRPGAVAAPGRPDPGVTSGAARTGSVQARLRGASAHLQAACTESPA